MKRDYFAKEAPGYLDDWAAADACYDCAVGVTFATLDPLAGFLVEDFESLFLLPLLFLTFLDGLYGASFESWVLEAFKSADEKVSVFWNAF